MTNETTIGIDNGFVPNTKKNGNTPMNPIEESELTIRIVNIPNTMSTIPIRITNSERFNHLSPFLSYT